jgi:hypothetical protein
MARCDLSFSGFTTTTWHYQISFNRSPVIEDSQLGIAVRSPESNNAMDLVGINHGAGHKESNHVPT